MVARVRIILPPTASLSTPATYRQVFVQWSGVRPSGLSVPPIDIVSKQQRRVAGLLQLGRARAPACRHHILITTAAAGATAQQRAASVM